MLHADKRSMSFSGGTRDEATVYWIQWSTWDTLEFGECLSK